MARALLAHPKVMKTPTPSQAFRNPPVARQLQTVAFGCVGSAGFLWLGIPGGAISGAMAGPSMLSKAAGPLAVAAGIGYSTRAAGPYLGRMAEYAEIVVMVAVVVRVVRG